MHTTEVLDGRRGKNHVETQWNWNLELRSAAEMIALICSADAGCGSRPVVADRGHGKARDAVMPRSLGMCASYTCGSLRREPNRVEERDRADAARLK